MASITFDELANFEAQDSEWITAIRYRVGDINHVLVGGRTGNATADDAAWVYDRLDVHADKDFEGFWGYNSPPLRATPSNLSVSNAEYQDDVAVLEDGDSLVATWGIAFRAQLASGAITFRYRIYRASDGSVAQNGTVQYNPTGDGLAEPIVSTPLEALDAGSYLLWVRIESATRPYRMPDDYTTISGKTSDNPVEYRWQHPVTGITYIYDPIWNVGAKPYMADHPLLVQRQINVDNELTKKHPEWVDNLIEFHNDGTQISVGGEWSALRLAVGGEWIGDENCHVDATPGHALWEVIDGVAVPLMLSPTLRSVGAFYTEPDGDQALWVGGMIAGRSGREVALFKTTGFSVQGKSLGVTSTASRWCECALSDEGLHSIARYPDRVDGDIYGLSFCEKFKRKGETLEASHPGGRSLVVATNANGRGRMSFATESDFADSKHHRRSFNYVLTQEGDKYTVGPGTSHHYDSVLAVYASSIWGIEEDDDGFQYLAFLDANGQDWSRTASWPKTLYDMGRLARVGSAMLIFGTDVNYLPMAMRLHEHELEFDISMSYHVRRADSVVSEDGTQENAFLICRKVDDENEPLDGYYLVEASRKTNSIIFGPFDCEGEGEEEVCSFCTTLEQFEEQDISTDALPLYLVWNGDCWMTTSIRPDEDDPPWLELVITETEVCYVLHGTITYDTNLWPYIEWTEEKECVDRKPCPDAECVHEELPDSVVYFETLFVNGSLSALLVGEAAGGEMAELDANYPYIWIRVDDHSPLPDMPGEEASEELVAALSTFKQRVRFEQETWLDIPARTRVDICYLIPTTYAIQPVVVPLY